MEEGLEELDGEHVVRESGLEKLAQVTGRIKVGVGWPSRGRLVWK